MDKNCGDCSTWTPEAGQERKNCAQAMCQNETSSNYKKITVNTDGCQVWRPIDSGKLQHIT